jgi:two-component system alkaline phosphatase synthesis response regulator PhoP
MATRTLIVGEDPRAAAELQRVLAEADIAADAITPDDVLLERWEGARPDAVIVDVDGSLDERLALAAELRRRLDRPALPAVVVGSRSPAAARTERIEALERGADEWLPRPVDPRELVARVRALLRRSSITFHQPLRLAELELDPDRDTVRVRGREVTLTMKEFELLRALMEAGGRTVGRRDLLERVWHHPPSRRSTSRTLDVHIRRLRQKLGSGGRRIVTVRSVGYRMDEGG